MSIFDKFSSLINNLVIKYQATISTRYKAITKRLNKDFWDSESEINHSRYVGSMGRGTAINGKSDIDMLMRLPADTYRKYNAYKTNGQSALLQDVKKSIAVTYPSTEIGGDGQVVVVKFSDMKFEVLPVFLNSEGNYIYPDSNDGGKWRITNPVAEIDAINESNKTYNNKTKHLSKMMRAWKQKNNVPIPGILIDTLAYNFMPTWKYNDKSYLYYDFMTRDFLKYLSEQNSEQKYWIAPGSKKYVYRNGIFEYKAKVSYNVALKALEYEDKKQNFSANGEWKKIFGGFFTG